MQVINDVSPTKFGRDRQYVSGKQRKVLGNTHLSDSPYRRPDGGALLPINNDIDFLPTYLSHRSCKSFYSGVHKVPIAFPTILRGITYTCDALHSNTLSHRRTTVLCQQNDKRTTETMQIYCLVQQNTPFTSHEYLLSSQDGRPVCAVHRLSSRK